MAKWKIPIILAIAAGAIGLLLFAGVSRNDLYMTTLDQWDPSRARRESVRVMGFVKEGTISLAPTALVTEFVMRNESGERTIPVSYKGVTPGLFRDGTNVIASGRLDSEGVFRATELMTKCPSKYEGMDAPHPEGIVPHAAEGPPPAAGATPPVAVAPPLGT